jgi:hypothetical protein
LLEHHDHPPQAHGDDMIANLGRRPMRQNPDTDTATSHPACKPGHTEWTYDYVLAKNDSDTNNGILPSRAQLASEAKSVWAASFDKNDHDVDEDDNDDDDDDGGNMLPSRAELATEERMLWRMADTPIP